jgi:uncharacterized protein YtpQ (UPF0354 family)
MGFLKKIFRNRETHSNHISSPSIALKEPTFLQIKSKIYPYFKQIVQSTDNTIPFPEDMSQVDLESTYEAPGVQLVIHNICEDLNCLYAVDNGNDLELIQNRHLATWEIDEQELREIAISNFRTLIMTNMRAEGDTNGIMFIIDGNLEAGLVLIDEIWEQLEDQIGESVVITVPSRDVIIATGKSNLAMINTLTENSKNTLRTADHPLAKNWFIRENNKWKFFKKIMD